MKKLVTGLLAHVDAGKTTLSEGLLYLGGEIRILGRVDHGDAFLDTYQLEKERGITIFSKQAILKTSNMEVTLLDTPGHVDFSAEMERTLQVLDYAVLVINGMDGVQSHTMTLWKLLERYQYFFLSTKWISRVQIMTTFWKIFRNVWPVVAWILERARTSFWKILQSAMRLFWKNIWKQER